MLTPIPPAYTISKAKPVIFDSKVPGPGEYDTANIFKPNSNSYSFSRSPRKIHDFYQVPGPGLYNPGDLRKSTGYSISRSPRYLSNINTKSPGPGDYTYHSLEKRYQYSISKAKQRSLDFSNSPGPGSYSPNTSLFLDSPPRMFFDKQPRMPRDSFLTPAPGQYEIFSNSKKGYTIPKAKAKLRVLETPGPGVYEIPALIGWASLKGK